jgi:hypothetical protein
MAASGGRGIITKSGNSPDLNKGLYPLGVIKLFDEGNAISCAMIGRSSVIHPYLFMVTMI